MKNLFSLVLLFFLAGMITVAQENPGINKDSLISSTDEMSADNILNKLKEAEARYKRGYYEGSYRVYLELYGINDALPALNYKLGMSALLGGKGHLAADYLLKSFPDVAKDYYLQLGFAFQARMDYSRAREAFQDYNDTLCKWRRSKFRPRFRQLMSECEFGEKHANDSVPAFVNNMGPTVNSYYDEYGAVEDQKFQRLFFTSRRPDRLPEIPVSRDKFSERVRVSEFVEGKAAEGNEVSRFNTRFHSSVAGISHQDEVLFIYRGKKRGGQVKTADISDKKVGKPRKISNRVDHKIFKETSISQASDGRVFFVSERFGGHGGKDIYTAGRKGRGGFARPVNLGTVVNSTGEEEAVHVTPDGNTLYFASNGHPGFGGFDIYKTERNKDGEWMTPVNIGQPYNSPYDDLFFLPSESDSLTRFVASTRPGGYGGLDIYAIQKDTRVPFVVSGTVVDDKDNEPLHGKISVIDTLNRQEILASYTDSLTGEYLIALEDTGSYQLQASSDGYKMETADLISPRERHASVYQDFELEKLQHPYTLKGTVTDVDTKNPVSAEISFILLENDSVMHRVFTDKNTGYYSFTFADKYDIEMNVSAKDYYIYSEELMLANTEGAEEVKNIEMEKSVITYMISGKVLEENTNKPVPARIEVFKPSDSEAHEIVFADTTSGKYGITLYEPGPFLVEVNADGYFFTNMALKFHPDTTLKVENIEMQPMAKGEKIVVENILFTTGKATLRAESYPELNRLARLLKENPTVRIEVSGHTDNVGSASLNKRLSRDRALSVKRYLESQGIEPGRIEYAGYGFDQPIAPNLTPEGRAQNRRVEIQVID